MFGVALKPQIETRRSRVRSSYKHLVAPDRRRIAMLEMDLHSWKKPGNRLPLEFGMAGRTIICHGSRCKSGF